MNKNNTSKNKTAESALVFTVVLLSFFLWDSIFVYPIKLFVVFLHESSHAIVILLSGGKISEITLGFDLGGKIIAEGGNEVAIYSAGYLGSLIIGLFIFISSELQKIRRYIFIGLAFIFLLIMVIASPTAEFVLIGTISICLFIFFAFFVRILLIKLFVKAFALVSAIYVLIDIKEDMLSNEFASDAQVLTSLLGIDHSIISLFWIVVSTILIWLTIKYFSPKEKIMLP